MYEEYPPSEYAGKMGAEYKYTLTLKTKHNESRIEENLHRKLRKIFKELIHSGHCDAYTLEWD